jgi:hypothetical protein
MRIYLGMWSTLRSFCCFLTCLEILSTGVDHRNREIYAAEHFMKHFFRWYAISQDGASRLLIDNLHETDILDPNSRLPEGWAKDLEQRIPAVCHESLPEYPVTFPFPISTTQQAMLGFLSRV